MRILIAGGAGFIGSNLARRFVAAGDSVQAVDCLDTGSAANLPAEVPLDMLDCAAPHYRERYAGEAWDAVVHLAGASSAPLFDQDPLRAAEAAAAFQNSLEVARAAGCPVVYASTSSLYGHVVPPHREDQMVQPWTLYEHSKRAMEQLAAVYARRYDTPTVGLRLFSVYGPREEAKGRYANIVTQFLWAMRKGQRPVVYGDGSQTRDFTHVEDVVGAVRTVLAKAPSGAQIYNVGTGRTHTFNQVVALLNEALGTDLAPQHVPNPVPNYVAATHADASRLQALGWQAHVSLAAGLRRAVAEAAPLAVPA